METLSISLWPRQWEEQEPTSARRLHAQARRPLTRECLWAVSRFSGARRQSQTQLLISLTHLLRHTHSVTDPPRRRPRRPSSPRRHWQVNGLDKSYIAPSSSDQSPRGFCYSVCVCQGHFFTQFSATDTGAIVPGRKRPAFITASLQSVWANTLYLEVGKRWNISFISTPAGKKRTWAKGF